MSDSSALTLNESGKECDSTIDTFIRDLLLVLSKDSIIGGNCDDSKSTMALAADLSPKICDLVKSLKESIVHNTLHGSTPLVNGKGKEFLDAAISTTTPSPQPPPQTQIDRGSQLLDDFERGVCNKVLARLSQSEQIVSSSDLLTLSDRFDKKLAAAAKDQVTADDIVMVDERITELSKVVSQTMDLSRSCESQMQAMAKRLKNLEKQGVQAVKSASDELEQEFAQREMSRRLGILENELRELAAKIQVAGAIMNERVEGEEKEKLKKMMEPQEVGSCCLKNINERMVELDGSLLTLRENVDNLWKHHEEDIAKLTRGSQRGVLGNKSSLPMPNEEIYNELMKACEAGNAASDGGKSAHGNSYQMWIVMLWRRIGELESEVRNMSLRGLGSGSSSVSIAEGGYDTFYTARCLEPVSGERECYNGGGGCNNSGLSSRDITSGSVCCLESFSTPQTEVSEKSEVSSPGCCVFGTNKNGHDEGVDEGFGHTLRLAPPRQSKKSIRISGDGKEEGIKRGLVSDMEEEYLSVYESPFLQENGNMAVAKGRSLNGGYADMSDYVSVKSRGKVEKDEEEDEDYEEDKEDCENQWTCYNDGRISASMQGVLKLDDKLRCLRSTIGRNDGAGVVMAGAPREVTNIGTSRGNEFRTYGGNEDGEEEEEENNYNSTATEHGSNYTIFSAGNNGTSIGGRNFASYFATPMKRPAPVYGNEKVLGFYKSEFYKDYTSTNPYHKSSAIRPSGTSINKYRHRLMRPFFKKSSGLNRE